ncbi:MAG TPA: FGGY family carbohydrate kinase [Bacteroidales bacterium]|nr:FGGY family carbohydrate kinase [Bacteroidales bacterium]
MKEQVIAIFDIGKTNKKLLLFDSDLRVVYEKEEKFSEITDDDGFECDDIDHIESWIKDSLTTLLRSETYELTAVNFTTYGATLAYMDENGKRLTPIYNYLKPVDDRIPENLYKRYGGRDEFCRRTASPALGMLNSGIQALWLKTVKPTTFAKVRSILHFPQYVSHLLTGKIYSERTSIGCHTALWDFDNMEYHYWTKSYGLNLPQPVPVETTDVIEFAGKKINVGIGIHDSSASLAPYFSINKGKFVLLSTGTWCINMNPFNKEILTADQLDKDCLCYMSITGQPVKSSRLFLGNLHDNGVKLISQHFNRPDDSYKKIRADKNLAASLKSRFNGRTVFFQTGPYSREFRDYVDMYEFGSFEEAYHQLMNELCDLTAGSVKLVLPENDDIENLYITGGFSKNELFLHLICHAFPDKKVYTSEISNASALGAALVISGRKPALNLGMTECFR